MTNYVLLDLLTSGLIHLIHNHPKLQITTPVYRSIHLRLLNLKSHRNAGPQEGGR